MKEKKNSKLTKIKEVLRNRKKILEGIKNFFWTSENIELVASYRNSVCMACDKIDIKGESCIAPGSQPCCSLCGCSLQFKTRSLSSSCPAKKWKAILTPEEEEEYLKNA